MPPSLSAGRGWRGSDGRGTPRHLCIVLALAVFGVTECDAAGGVTIFEVGQAIDMRPWPVLAMYIMVIIVSVFYELLTHHIEHVVTSRSGKAIVAHVYKEVMILGGISLLLTILENSGGDLLFEPVFYHYVHFVIFFMAINLISGISCLFLFINRSWRKWLFFETTVTGIEHDPRLTLDERHAVLNQYVKRCPDGHKMLACVLFFRSNLPEAFKRCSFTRYMKKQQRKELLSFLHLTASAWAALAVLMLMVAVQSYIAEKVVGVTQGAGGSGSGSGSGAYPNTANLTADAGFDNATQPAGCLCPEASGSGSGGGILSESYGEEFNLNVMLLFIGIEGYGTLCFMLMCWLKVAHSYNRFAQNIESMRKENKLRPIVPQHYYFWRGKPKFLMQLLQVMLLCQVFYLATITCNLGPRLVKIKGGIFILALAVIPTVLVFVVLIPNLMPKFTILTSLGDLLCMETLQHIQLADDRSGKYRRIHHRTQTTLAPPPMFEQNISPLDDYVEALIKQEREGRALGTAGGGQHYALLPESPGLEHGGHSGHQQPLKASKHDRLPDLICEECSNELAHVNCGVCGMLCKQCDLDYHRLKRNQGHMLIAIKAGQAAGCQTGTLLTDQPLLQKAAVKARQNSHEVEVPLELGGSIALS